MNDLVFIGLGSNGESRERRLYEALEALRCIDDAAVVGASSLYDSAPVGPPQPRFLNAVVALRCSLPPRRLLTILKHIERELGRRPGPRWGPREIDLDILLWGGRIVAEPDLQVPHIELHKRAFTLEPLCELIPEAHHPIFGRTMAELLIALEPQDVVPHSATLWPDEGAPSAPPEEVIS